MKTLLVALSTAALWGIGVVALHLPAQPVRAQEPTPTPIVDLGLERDAVFSLIGPEPKITWRALDAVDHFQLTATLQAARVNRADPFCARPAQAETRTLSVDEMLPGAATEFTVTFPPVVEGDAWFVYLSQVSLEALDAAGLRIGGQLVGGIAETLCARPVLPATGTGQTRDDSRAWIYGGLAGSLLIVLTFGLRMFGRQRQH